MLAQDNQQVTTSWITGIIEGEGHFEKRDYNFFRVHIANTDLDIIQACERFFIQNYILYTKSQETKKTKTGKINYRLHVSSHDCKKLHKLLSPVMQCRLDQFDSIVGSSTTTCDGPLIPDFDWLIGIWQAEGTFYLSQNQKGIFVPYLSLENTNEKIIQKLAITLRDIGCSWYCHDFKPDSKKAFTRIALNGIKRCQRFLIKTQNKWLSKRDTIRSSLLLEYIQSRLSKSQQEPYSVREKEIWSLLKYQNL